MPYVYIVRCADDTLYTGWAVDVDRRVAAHNCGQGAKYTSTRGPVTLVYTEEVASVGEALRRELAIKRYPRAKKLALATPVKLAQPVKRRRRKTAKGRSTKKLAAGNSNFISISSFKLSLENSVEQPRITFELV